MREFDLAMRNFSQPTVGSAQIKSGQSARLVFRDGDQGSKLFYSNIITRAVSVTSGRAIRVREMHKVPQSALPARHAITIKTLVRRFSRASYSRFMPLQPIPSEQIKYAPSKHKVRMEFFEFL